MTRRFAAAAILTALALPSNAGELPKAAAVEVAEYETIVELVSIDRTAHAAVLRGADGVARTMLLPREAQNLDRVKPGDRFRMRYVEAVAVALHKGGAASAAAVQTVELAPRGGTPGGRIVDTKRVSALVTAVDRGQRTLALEGPQKTAMMLKVADEVRSFDDIAAGDTIEVIYTEALMMELVPAASR
jgi:hypothetical protein